MSKARDIADSAATINALDGVTATGTELNILDGVTATTAELNILDGVTATTAELNYVDGVTSNLQTQIDAKATLASSPTFTGTVTASAFSGDGSALTNLPATGGAADFVAQGAISNGATVALRSDGKVEAVTGTQQVEYDGSTILAETLTTVHDIQGVYDPTNNKVVVIWGTSTVLYYLVGTPSGNAITWGTSGSVATDKINGNLGVHGVGYDPDADKIVIWYENNSGLPTILVGTISGTSMTFGSAASLSGVDFSRENGFGLQYDTEHNTWHFAFENASTSKATIAPFTISGSTVTWGSSHVIDTSNGSKGATCVYLPSLNKILVGSPGTSTTHRFYLLDYDGSSYTTDVTTTVTSGSITPQVPQISYDDDNATAIFTIKDGGTQVIAYAATVTASSVTAGTTTVIHGGTTDTGIANLTYDAGAGYWWYYDVDSSDGNASLVKLTVSGTTITTERGLFFDEYSPTGNASGGDIIHNSATGMNYGVFTRTANTNDISYYAFRPYALRTNADNFIGFAEAAISSGATGTITILSGTNTSQSSLTTGSKYWVEYDGTLKTTQTQFPEAGFAISATSIVMANTNDTAQSGSRWMYSSSALSAGDLVFSKGDTAGALTITPDLNPTKSISNTNITWSNMGGPQQIVAHPGGYVIIFRNTSTNYLNAIAVSDSGGALTAGTQTALFSAGLNSGTTNMKCVYHELDNRFWVVYGGTSNQTYVGSFTVSGTTITYVNQSTPYYYGQYYYDMDIDQATGRILINTLYTGSTSKYVIGFKPNGSSTGTFYATNYSGSSAVTGVTSLYVPEHDKWVITEQYNPYTVFRHVTFDGESAPTVSTATNINPPGSFWDSSGQYTHSRSWSSYYDRIILLKPDGNLSPAQTRMDVYTFDGTSFAHENQINMYAVNSDNAYSTYYTYDFKRVFNPFNTEYIYVGTSGGYNAYTYDSSAGTLTRVFGPQSLYSSGFTTDYAIYGVKFHYQTLAASSGYGGQYPVATTDSANFLGFAKNACSANTTVEINAAGAIDTNQTGLTANTKYYVDDLGSLTTTDTGTFAGTALTPNNVYVKV